MAIPQETVSISPLSTKGRVCHTPIIIDVTEAYRSLGIIIGILEAGRTNRRIRFPVAHDAYPLDL